MAASQVQNRGTHRSVWETPIGISGSIHHLFLLPAPLPNPVPLPRLFNLPILREAGEEISRVLFVLLLCIRSWVKYAEQEAGDFSTCEHPLCY